jgi:energy-coupling factor transporter ATP-binding protein EcfA2
MRLHSVGIENFRGIVKHDFSFCEPGTDKPRRLTVLVGPNMSGKTTVLDAIHLAFEAVSHLDHPNLRPDLNASDPGLRPDPHLPIRIRLRFSLDPVELQALQGLQNLLGDPPAPAYDGVYELGIRWPPKEGADGPAKIVESSVPWGANYVLRGRALARIAKSRRLIAEGIFEHVGGILYLDQHRSVQLAVPSVRTANEEQLRDAAGSRDVLPWLELQSRLDQKWDPATQGPSAWSRVKALFADLAAPSAIDDIKAMEEGFDLRFRQGDRFYYSAGLSFGQRQILRLVTNMTAFRAVRSIILIDELELHLHPSWQRKLLHFMRRGGGDDNQFIVTTHSESFTKYLHPDEVAQLGDLDGPG